MLWRSPPRWAASSAHSPHRRLPGDRLDELAFELPLAGWDEPVSAARLADYRRAARRVIPADDPLAGYAQRLRDPMLAASLRGYLTGSIDLVLRVYALTGAGAIAS